MGNPSDVKAAPQKAKAPRIGTKRPGKKGLHRIREIVPLSTSPKCKKVYWPHGTF